MVIAMWYPHPSMNGYTMIIMLKAVSVSEIIPLYEQSQQDI